MASRARRSTVKSLIVALIALGVWGWEQWQKSHPTAGAGSSQPVPTKERRDPAPPSSSPGSNAGAVAKKGNYELYQGCTLAEEKNNDGDSFLVKLPGGRQEMFRLYFVDTPESVFKTYRGGESNHQRIAEQAEYFNRITPEQAVEIGQRGKHFTLDLLGSKPFTIYTRWDDPFGDRRFHAFIQVEEGGKTRWLDELLVERGFCRIHTKGAEMPDGTSTNARKDQLRAIEREAKNRRAGAWGLR